MGWQPIETAPKDGTQILLAAMLPETPDHFARVAYVESGCFEHVVNDEDDIWDVADNTEPRWRGREAGVYWHGWSPESTFDHRGRQVRVDEFTLWMPLPEPPA
jgi:hypothetical protein